MPWGGDGHNVQLYTRKTVLFCLGNWYKIFWKKSFSITFSRPSSSPKFKLFTVCRATKTGEKKLPKVHTRQPKLAIWSLMIGSFSISYCNFLTSLILATQEILGEYKLMSCLPKAFPVFSSFSFSSCCLYSAYVLLIVSLLALSTYSCVPLRPNKYTLPLLMTLFKHSRFLCCSMPSFGVSTLYPKKSSSFNMFSTSAIIFITGRNRHHINIRYKGNINNTSVIIFLMDNLDDFCKLSRNSH